MADRLAKAAELKASGLAFFKAGDFSAAANEYRKPDSDSCVAVEACPTCCPEGEYLKPGTTDTCVEVFALRSLFRTCMGCWQPPALTGFWTCEGCLDGDQG